MIVTQFSKPSSFRHSGDLGDIVFALPTIRALGGGVLYLDPEGGQSSPWVMANTGKRTKLTRETIAAITPILVRQEYIKEVCLWAGEPVDYDLDEFRKHLQLNNLSDSHLTAFGLPLTERDRAWLTITDPIVIQDRPIVISRSVRYQGNHIFWEDQLQIVKDQCVFVGYSKDHEILEYTFEVKIPYFATPDLLTLARVIAGCRKFIGNQGLPHALAEGMKKDLINETYRPRPGGIFLRPGARYV
jgi:hypothetical protein